MYDMDVLWFEFNEKLLNYIKIQVSNSHDAEDILQNVFVKIFKGIEKLDNEAAIKPWIYRITRNTIIDYYKKKKDVSVSPETLHRIEADIDDVDNMNDDIASYISGMLFSLPDKYQDVFNLYEKKDMKHKEIAETLGISVSTSKIRLKRAKEMFKVKLLDCCDFEVDKYGNIIDYVKKSDCDKDC